MNVYDGLVRYVLVVVLLCSTLFYFVLLYSTLFYFILLCSTSVVLQLTGCSWIHGGFVTLDFELFIAEFISFSCKLQPICSERASAALYVCILLHNTYIHTYIPPLGGVCMYVCMYIVKNYILYKCIYYIIHTIQFDELLMMHFDELLQCSV